MAKHRNSIKLEGFLASDFKIQNFNSGSKKIRFKLENHNEYKDKTEKHYFVVEAWNKVADSFMEHQVGDHVRLEGSLAQSIYKKKNGEVVDEGTIVKAIRYDWKVWNNGPQDRPQQGGNRWESDESDEAF